MGLEIPDELKPVAALVVTKWPEADETGLRGAADQWDQIADLIDQLNDYGGDVVKVVLANTQGETHDSIDQFWKKAGGDEGALGELSEFCRELAFALRVMAMLVLAVKVFIIGMLVYLAVQLAISAALAVETLGASVAEGAAVQMTVRTAITQALQKLLQEIAVKTIIKRAAVGAGIGAGIGAGKEFGFQSLEKFLGLRDGYDWQDVASEGVHGGIQGAIAGPISNALKDKGIKFSNNGATDWFIRSTIGKKIGDPIADAAWGDNQGIGDRVKDDAGKYVRQQAVEFLTEQGSGTDTPAVDTGSGQRQNHNPAPLAPTTPEEGYELYPDSRPGGGNQSQPPVTAPGGGLLDIGPDDFHTDDDGTKLRMD
ncbi:hypothetical protein BJY24_003631 [Nocardia transvalensis]|uniref:Outer membrane channel protein CpnT-like N-terminal domain-containing protein n=1 Tax=Nocardia transvalensis TaxID=37333 RepID=A0A7W9UIV3_9NOCA|nr:hypothetical protein [Nocardia transvalensis]MBB5914764.1 hypothetical protein [Nocardia transvalensis]